MQILCYVYATYVAWPFTKLVTLGTYVYLSIGSPSFIHLVRTCNELDIMAGTGDIQK